MNKDDLNTTVNKKLKKIEDTLVPGVNWDKAASWEKIKSFLDTKNKKLVLWYFATAASVSLVLATTLDQDLNVYKSIINELITDSEVALNDDSILPQEPHSMESLNAIEPIEISPKTANDKIAYTCVKPKVQYLSVEAEELKEVKLEGEFLPSNNDSELKFHPSVSIGSGFGNNSMQVLNPGLSMDLRYQFKNHQNKQQFISVGVNTNILTYSTPESSANVYPATFVTTSYGVNKMKKTGKKTGWELEAGYLLNPDQIIYHDTTFRLQYQKSVFTFMKVGPELIITDNFKRVYPGFTLVFS